MNRAFASSVVLALIACGHAPPPATQAPAPEAAVEPRSTDAAASAPASTDEAAAQASTAASSEPTRDQIRTFADLTVRDWIDGERGAIYRRMSRRYREAYSAADLGRVVDQLDQIFGKVRTVEYKSISVGTATTDRGVIKMWRLWYAVATDKHAMGNHFATVDVIAEPDLAILAFQITTFTNGVPPNLR